MAKNKHNQIKVRKSWYGVNPVTKVIPDKKKQHNKHREKEDLKNQIEDALIEDEITDEGF